MRHAGEQAVSLRRGGLGPGLRRDDFYDLSTAVIPAKRSVEREIQLRTRRVRLGPR